MEENELKIYSERYTHLRTEILQRMANRYILLKALLTVIGSGIVVARYFDYYEIGYAVCIAISALGILAYGENSHIASISNYLISIERKIDSKFKLQPLGWERHSRSKAKEDSKLKATRLLALGAISAYELIYLAFNIQGSFAFQDYPFLSFLDILGEYKLAAIIVFMQLWAIIGGVIIFVSYVKLQRKNAR